MSNKAEKLKALTEEWETKRVTGGFFRKTRRTKGKPVSCVEPGCLLCSDPSSISPP